MPVTGNRTTHRPFAAHRREWVMICNPVFLISAFSVLVLSGCAASMPAPGGQMDGNLDSNGEALGVAVEICALQSPRAELKAAIVEVGLSKEAPGEIRFLSIASSQPVGTQSAGQSSTAAAQVVARDFVAFSGTSAQVDVTVGDLVWRLQLKEVPRGSWTPWQVPRGRVTAPHYEVLRARGETPALAPVATRSLAPYRVRASGMSFGSYVLSKLGRFAGGGSGSSAGTCG